MDVITHVLALLIGFACGGFAVYVYAHDAIYYIQQDLFTALNQYEETAAAYRESVNELAKYKNGKV